MLTWTQTPFGSKPPVPRGNGELVLVVDDQQDIRDLLEAVLTDHGYRTLLAVDGDDALSVFKRQADNVAAVITDLNMPHIEGGSLADLLRQYRADLPILFMSGLNQSAARHGAMLATTKHPFLLKPFRPIALLDAIHQLLRRRCASKS
jgi:CheY-like chemotaxis protein